MTLATETPVQQFSSETPLSYSFTPHENGQQYQAPPDQVTFDGNFGAANLSDIVLGEDRDYLRTAGGIVAPEPGAVLETAGTLLGKFTRSTVYFTAKGRIAEFPAAEHNEQGIVTNFPEEVKSRMGGLVAAAEKFTSEQPTRFGGHALEGEFRDATPQPDMLFREAHQQTLNATLDREDIIIQAQRRI